MCGAKNSSFKKSEDQTERPFICRMVGVKIMNQVRRLCLFADTDSEGTESNRAIEATQVKDKRVLMRVDFNVPTPETSTHLHTDSEQRCGCTLKTLKGCTKMQMVSFSLTRAPLC